MDLTRYVIRNKTTGDFISVGRNGEPRTYLAKGHAQNSLNWFIDGWRNNRHKYTKDDFEIVSCILNIPDDWDQKR